MVGVSRAGAEAPRPNDEGARARGAKALEIPINWDFMGERVTGIEPASRAWEQLDVDLVDLLSSGFDSP